MKAALKQCDNAQIMTFSSETALKLVDHLSTAVLLFDDELRLICINAAGEDMLSVSSKRITGY